jgi:hypothetical protein
MRQHVRRLGGLALVLAAGFVGPVGAQGPPDHQAHAAADTKTGMRDAAGMATAPGIIPSGFGEAVDRDVARARAATARFKSAEAAVAAGYPATTQCVEKQPEGAMGLHYGNIALQDTTLDVEKPEVLVYEKMADGSVKLNGVEYIVPLAAWKGDQPPALMGQPFKKAEGLGIWYLHVWIWEPSPTGLFANWNPRVKCL